MFKCQLTGKQSLRYEKPVRIVTKTRPKIYYGWDPKKKEQVEIGRGWEIVEEKLVCEEAAQHHQVIKSAREIMKTHAPVLKRLAE